MAICRERACIFPAIPGSEYCRHHVKFFLFPESLTGSGLERTDPIRVQMPLANWSPGTNKAVYYTLKRLGQCVKCWRPKQGSSVLCLVCSLKWNAKKAAKRGQWRASGLCIKCGRPKDAEHVECLACRNSAKAWRGARIARRLCFSCARPSPDGRTKCARCRTLQARARARRHVRGFCLGCGTRKDSGHLKCLSCRIRHSRAMRDYYARNPEKYLAKNRRFCLKRREEKMKHKYGRPVALRFGDIRVRGTEFTIAQLKRYVKKEKAAR